MEGEHFEVDHAYSWELWIKGSMFLKGWLNDCQWPFTDMCSQCLWLRVCLCCPSCWQLGRSSRPELVTERLRDMCSCWWALHWWEWQLTFQTGQSTSCRTVSNMRGINWVLSYHCQEVCFTLSSTSDDLKEWGEAAWVWWQLMRALRHWMIWMVVGLTLLLLICLDLVLGVQGSQHLSCSSTQWDSVEGDWKDLFPAPPYA